MNLGAFYFCFAKSTNKMDVGNRGFRSMSLQKLVLFTGASDLSLQQVPPIKKMATYF